MTDNEQQAEKAFNPAEGLKHRLSALARLRLQAEKAFNPAEGLKLVRGPGCPLLLNMAEKAFMAMRRHDGRIGRAQRAPAPPPTPRRPRPPSQRSRKAGCPLGAAVGTEHDAVIGD